MATNPSVNTKFSDIKISDKFPKLQDVVNNNYKLPKSDELIYNTNEEGKISSLDVELEDGEILSILLSKSFSIDEIENKTIDELFEDDKLYSLYAQYNDTEEYLGSISNEDGSYNYYMEIEEKNDDEKTTHSELYEDSKLTYAEDEIKNSKGIVFDAIDEDGDGDYDAVQNALYDDKKENIIGQEIDSDGDGDIDIRVIKEDRKITQQQLDENGKVLKEQTVEF